MSHLYEVEIKSLLGSKKNADALKVALKKKYADLALVGKGKQLNHYFNVPDDLTHLQKVIAPKIPADKQVALTRVVKEGKKVSVRSRDADGKVLFVIKASVGSDTSANGVTRIEFDAEMKDMTLADLDKLLLDAGFTYQAKWSREREEYAHDDLHICIDKNAGYGYVAEFEKVTADEASLENVRTDLLSFMKEMGAEELDQARLERMFAHYNTHWPEYYGTEKTFIIE